MRTNLPLAFGDLTPLTLGIGELLAYIFDPLPEMWDSIGDSGDNFISNETCDENENRYKKGL